MRKYFGCMVAGAAVSLVGIRGDYHNKLAIFYTSQQYENVNRLLQARWREKKNGDSESMKKFVKVTNPTMDFQFFKNKIKFLSLSIGSIYDSMYVYIMSNLIFFIPFSQII